MTGGELTFPLVPRFRLLGIPFGAAHSSRRGIGSDVAGTRPYAPGDDVGAIDWNASARLSTARNADEFVVRDRFADEAPRVVAFCDRRPAMALYPTGLPWLRKAEVIRSAMSLLAASVYRARGLLGYLDLADPLEPFWNPPTSEQQWRRLEEELLVRPFEAPVDDVRIGLDFLHLVRIAIPPGSFVFVFSDFLVAPPPEAWLSAVEHGWDVVPVVIQDPTWEQSFPDISGIAVPIVDAETGKAGTIRLRRAQARALRDKHSQRMRELLDGFAALGIEPVVLSSVNEEDALGAFLDWADRRSHLGEAWRLGA